ncbi:MAG: hypothetical protein JSR39_09695 [Verrucomicrobia bacterium]|nr:hypothetical protein [Verrucomicrobiota bacterium]
MTSWFAPIILASFAATVLHSDEQQWIEEDGDQWTDEYVTQDWVSDAGDSEGRQDAKKSHAQKKHIYPSQSSNGAMFSSAAPCFKSKWGIIAFGDWLYWKASEEGLNYAVQSLEFAGRGVGSSIQTRGIDGKVHHISPGYHSGFRIGASAIFPRDKWDLLFYWTSYHNDSESSVKQKSLQLAWPILLNNNNNPIALSAKADWKLHYNVLDLELGRSFFVAKHLSVRPFIAFQAAWIEQNLDVEYFNINFLQFGQVFPGNDILSRTRNHFSGYGLRSGVNTKWPLFWGISLLGNVSFSLLCSDFDISQHEKNINDSPRTSLKDDLHLTSQNLQMFGGICWEWQFMKNRCYINLHAGWEQQIWFDQNQMNIFLDNSRLRANVGNTINQQGDLTLSGLALGAAFGF